MITHLAKKDLMKKIKKHSVQKENVTTKTYKYCSCCQQMNVAILNLLYSLAQTEQQTVNGRPGAILQPVCSCQSGGPSPQLSPSMSMSDDLCSFLSCQFQYFTNFTKWDRRSQVTNPIKQTQEWKLMVRIQSQKDCKYLVLPPNYINNNLF